MADEHGEGQAVEEVGPKDPETSDGKKPAEVVEMTEEERLRFGIYYCHD